VRGAGLGFPFCVPFPLLGLVSCAEGHGLIDRLLPLPATSTQSKNSMIKLVVLDSRLDIITCNLVPVQCSMFILTLLFPIGSVLISV
jgi:hypothetical protein